MPLTDSDIQAINGNAEAAKLLGWFAEGCRTATVRTGDIFGNANANPLAGRFATTLDATQPVDHGLYDHMLIFTSGVLDQHHTWIVLDYTEDQANTVVFDYRFLIVDPPMSSAPVVGDAFVLLPIKHH